MTHKFLGKKYLTAIATSVFMAGAATLLPSHTYADEVAQVTQTEQQNAGYGQEQINLMLDYIAEYAEKARVSDISQYLYLHEIVRLGELHPIAGRAAIDALLASPAETTFKIVRLGVVHESLAQEVIEILSSNLKVAPTNKGARTHTEALEAEALEGLSEIGAAHANYAPVVWEIISPFLQNNNLYIKSVAIVAVGRIGAANEAYAKNTMEMITPFIVYGVGSDDYDKRSVEESAIYSIGNIGTAFPEFAELALDLLRPYIAKKHERNNGWGARRSAVKAYKKIALQHENQSGLVFDELKSSLLINRHHRNSDTSTIEALGKLGLKYKDLTEEAFATLSYYVGNTGDKNIRRFEDSYAFRNITNIAKAYPQYRQRTLEIIKPVLAGGNYDKIRDSISKYIIENYGADTLKQSVAEMVAIQQIKLQKDGSESSEKYGAMRSLGNMGAAFPWQAKAILSILRPFLDQSYSADTRERAVRAFHEIGLANKNLTQDVLATLKPLVSDPERKVRGEAITGIAYIASENTNLTREAVDIIFAGLESEHEGLRKHTAQYLLKLALHLDEHTQWIFDKVAPKIMDKNPRVQEMAIAIVGSIGYRKKDYADAAYKAILPSLTSTDDSVKKLASEILETLKESIRPLPKAPQLEI